MVYNAYVIRLSFYLFVLYLIIKFYIIRLINSLLFLYYKFSYSNSCCAKLILFILKEEKIVFCNNWIKWIKYSIIFIFNIIVSLNWFITYI